MKAERFVREYANQKIRTLRELSKNYPDKKERHECMIDEINWYVDARAQQTITVDECMILIANV
jgi:hypothetical protein